MKLVGSGPNTHKFDRKTVRQVLNRVNTYVEVIAKEEIEANRPHIEGMLVFQLLSDLFLKNIDFNFRKGGLTPQQAEENKAGLKNLAASIFAEGVFEEGNADE